MRFVEFCNREFFGQTSVVPKFYAVAPNFHLNRHTHIVFVDNRIENRLAECILGNFKRFDALQSFVMYRRNKIFCFKGLNNGVTHFQDVTFYKILKNEVGVVPAKKSYLEIHARDKILRTLAKQKYCGVFEFAVSINEMEISQNIFGATVQRFVWKSLCINRFAQKVIHRLSVNVVDGGLFADNVVPSATEFFQHKLLQRYSVQLLFGAARTIMVNAFKRDRYIAWRNIYLDVFFAVLGKYVDICHNSQKCDNLVWYIFRKAVSVFYAADVALVVDADVEFAALRIRKATNPLQIIVAPSFLVFDVLVFSVHKRCIVLLPFHQNPEHLARSLSPRLQCLVCLSRLDDAADEFFNGGVGVGEVFDNSLEI